MSCSKTFYKKFFENYNVYKNVISNIADNDISESQFHKVVFYDTLDNNGANDLLRKLYSLDKKRYKVSDLRHIKPKKLKDWQMLELQYNFSSVGIFAKIEFLDTNCPFGKLEISWSQRSNYSCVFEYELYVRKDSLDTFQKEVDFINENIKLKNRKNIRQLAGSYILNDIKKNKENKLNLTDDGKRVLLQAHNTLLKDIIQTFLENIIYSPNARNEQLLSFYYYFDNALDKQKMKAPFMGWVAKHKTEDVVMFSNDHDIHGSLPTVIVVIKKNIHLLVY